MWGTLQSSVWGTLQFVNPFEKPIGSSLMKFLNLEIRTSYGNTQTPVLILKLPIQCYLVYNAQTTWCYSCRDSSLLYCFASYSLHYQLILGFQEAMESRKIWIFGIYAGLALIRFQPWCWETESDYLFSQQACAESQVNEAENKFQEDNVENIKTEGVRKNRKGPKDTVLYRPCIQG